MLLIWQQLLDKIIWTLFRIGPTKLKIAVYSWKLRLTLYNNMMIKLAISFALGVFGYPCLNIYYRIMAFHRFYKSPDIVMGMATYIRLEKKFWKN